MTPCRLIRSCDAFNDALPRLQRRRLLVKNACRPPVTTLMPAKATGDGGDARVLGDTDTPVSRPHSASSRQVPRCGVVSPRASGVRPCSPFPAHLMNRTANSARPLRTHCSTPRSPSGTAQGAGTGPYLAAGQSAFEDLRENLSPLLFSRAQRHIVPGHSARVTESLSSYGMTKSCSNYNHGQRN